MGLIKGHNYDNLTRNGAVSISRGFAILLMVLSHASVIRGYANTCIYLFHMPLFFVMSGLCFKDKYLSEPVLFVKRKFIGIYIPTIFWGLLFIFLHNVFYNLNVYNDSYGYLGNVSYVYGLEHYLKKSAILLVKLNGFESLLGGYWFMHTLFFASFIYFFTRKIITKESVAVVFLLLISVVCCCQELGFPYMSIGSREMVAATFMSIGHIARKYVDDSKYHFIIVSVGIIALLLGGFLWPSNMNNYSTVTLIPFVLTATLSSFAIYIFSSFLANVESKKYLWINRFLTYAGDHSFAILTFHFLSFKVVSLLYIWSHNIQIDRLAEFPIIEEVGIIWNVMYFVVGVLLPLILSKTYNSLCSRLVEHK